MVRSYRKKEKDHSLSLIIITMLLYMPLASMWKRGEIEPLLYFNKLDAEKIQFVDQ